MSRAPAEETCQFWYFPSQIIKFYFAPRLTWVNINLIVLVLWLIRVLAMRACQIIGFVSFYCFLYRILLETGNAPNAYFSDRIGFSYFCRSYAKL